MAVKKYRPKRRMAPWLGAWLRIHRLKSGKVLGDIAVLLGRDYSAISRYETGECSYPADDLPLVLRAYGLSARQFAKRAREVAA